jgi:hypothetical protein
MYSMNAREKLEHKKWNRLFIELEKYTEKNGHCDCPIKKNGSLREWINR